MITPEILKKEEFQSLKQLADLNVAISETQESFQKLEMTESEYLAKREEKALVQIEELYKNSAELLEGTHKNYEGVNTFCNIVTSYKDFLDENYRIFQEMLTDFNERNDLWEKRYKEQVHEFSRQEKIIKEDAEKLKKGQEEVEKQKEQIKKDKTLLEDRRRTFQRSIERLKLGKK